MHFKTIRLPTRTSSRGQIAFEGWPDVSCSRVKGATLTLAYALRPGISVDGLLEYSRYKSNDAAGPDSQGSGIGLGTAISF